MNNYNCLDLDIVKQEVASFASIFESQEYIVNEEVVFNPLVIRQNSLLTSEAMKIIKDNINVQFAGIKNINEIFDKADKGITLQSIELKDALVLHNNCVRIHNIFKNIKEDLKIKDYSESLLINEYIFNEINKCIDNSGLIKEDATSELSRINSSISKLDKDLYNKAQQFISRYSSSLQEQAIFKRENRITFLIKNSDKNKYQGLSYGTSASGLASYVEPGMFVEMNNQMINLINDRQNEIDRILRYLTYQLSTVTNDYRNNFESLMKLNVIFSKANYGIKHNCIIPEFVEGNDFEFNDLCHPLIDESKVVSNTYRLYEPYQGVVISGSNTGGKTVSLKAIGLSTLMSYLGIPIIASGAYIPIYRNIYVDIDDNQSIQDSLSTFSAHISNINNILTEANKDSLILIDELISGTDPKEAQAISLAILDKIKQIGSKFVITTHFDDIKNYSYKDEHILLSSVGFDTNTLKPTYKYFENSIGTSNALDIASRYFDDKSIIDNARNYIKISQTKQDELLTKLSKQMEEINIQKDNIEQLEKTYNQLVLESKKQIKDFEIEKIELRNKYLNELKDFVEDIKIQANEKLNSINVVKDKKSFINSFNDLIDNDVKQEKVEIKVGDNVRIGDNEQIGEVIEITDDKATINLRGLTIKADLLDLTLMPKIVKKQIYKEHIRKENVPKEINLVGQRVEDGLVLMEEYLDKANGNRLSSVKIIHGIGTGTLRSAIRQRLKKLAYVSSFKDGDFYDGGSAVTIVEFK